jgi:uracil-DNA glycosylase
MAATSTDSQGRLAIRLPRRRRRFDDQPTQAASVLLACNGTEVSARAIDRAIRLAEGEPVAVVTIARVYGSAFGLPNPGLMPTGKEMIALRDQVQTVLAALERRRVVAWGQVAATRRPGRAIAQVARVRGVKHVVLSDPHQSGLRRLVEGDLAKEIQRRLGADVKVVRIT